MQGAVAGAGSVLATEGHGSHDASAIHAGERLVGDAGARGRAVQMLLEAQVIIALCTVLRESHARLGEEGRLGDCRGGSVEREDGQQAGEADRTQPAHALYKNHVYTSFNEAK